MGRGHLKIRNQKIEKAVERYLHLESKILLPESLKLLTVPRTRLMIPL